MKELHELEILFKHCFKYYDLIDKSEIENQFTSLIKDLSQQLMQPVVVGQSEQLICECQERTFYEWEKSDNKCAECLRQLYTN